MDLSRCVQAVKMTIVWAGGTKFIIFVIAYRSGIKVPRFLMFLGLGWNKI